jgi:hypothetical protein
MSPRINFQVEDASDLVCKRRRRPKRKRIRRRKMKMRWRRRIRMETKEWKVRKNMK